MPSRSAARSAVKQQSIAPKTLDVPSRRDRSTDLDAKANAADARKKRRKSGPADSGNITRDVPVSELKPDSGETVNTRSTPDMHTDCPEISTERADIDQAFRIGERVQCCDDGGSYIDWKDGTVTGLSPLFIRRDGVSEALVWDHVRKKQANQAVTSKAQEKVSPPCIKAGVSQKNAFESKAQGTAGKKRLRSTKHESVDADDANTNMADSPVSVVASSPPKSEGEIDAISTEQSGRKSNSRSKNSKSSEETSYGASGAATPPQASKAERDSTSPVKAVGGKSRARKTSGRRAVANPLHAAFARASTTHQTPSIIVDQSPDEKTEDANSPLQPTRDDVSADRKRSDVDANLERKFDDTIENSDGIKSSNTPSDQQQDELQNSTEELLGDCLEGNSEGASASQKTSLQLKGIVPKKRLFGKTSGSEGPQRRGTLSAFAKNNGIKPLVSRSDHQAKESCEDAENPIIAGMTKDEVAAANEEKSSETGAKSRDPKQNKQRKLTKQCFDSLKKTDALVQDLQDEPTATKQCLPEKTESSTSSGKSYTMKRFFSKQKESAARDGEVSPSQPLNASEFLSQDDRDASKQSSSTETCSSTQEDDSAVIVSATQRLMTLFQNNKKTFCAAPTCQEIDGDDAQSLGNAETKDVECVNMDVDAEATVDQSKKTVKALPPGVDSLPAGVRWNKDKHLITATRRSDKKELKLSVKRMTVQSAIKQATEFIERDNAALAEAERASRPKLWTDRHRPQHLKWIKCPCWEMLGRWLRSWSSGPPSKRAALVCGAVGVGKSTGAKLAIERCKNLGGERRLIEYDLKDKEGRTFIENLCKGQTAYASGSLTNTVVLLEIDGADRNFLTYMSRRVLKQSIMPIVIVCSDSALVQDSGISECCLRIEVPNQPTQQVADSLQRIASTENLIASPEAWMAFAEACGGDLRRAVNSMQLLGAPSEVNELLDTVATPQAACSRLLAKTKESAPLGMHEREALLSIDEELLPLMIQENYLRACCVEENSLLGVVLEDNADDKALHNLQVCAEAADVLAWGDILCCADGCAGDVELAHSALLMSAALPSALMANCELSLGKLADGSPAGTPALRCMPPEITQSGPHPLHWAAVNELTRQFGLPRERICDELLRWKRAVGKSKEEPRKAPRDMAARLKRFTSAVQMASSSAAEAAMKESSEAGIYAGSVYYIESCRSTGCYLDDGGDGLVRLTQGNPSEGNWAQFKLILRSGQIYNVESIRSPGYFLDDCGNGSIRLTQSTPTDDDTWAQFKLSRRDDNVFNVESVRSTGHFLDDGGDGIIRLTQSSPGVEDLWGQFKMALYQMNQDSMESIPETPPDSFLTLQHIPATPPKNLD